MVVQWIVSGFEFAVIEAPPVFLVKKSARFSDEVEHNVITLLKKYSHKPAIHQHVQLKSLQHPSPNFTPTNIMKGPNENFSKIVAKLWSVVH